MHGMLSELQNHYRNANGCKFEGILPKDYRIALNPKLRRLTGRITYGLKLIELSSFHVRTYGYPDAVATLEHEMLHLYLHTLGRPSGHTSLFKDVARSKEIRVFHANPYPKNRTSRQRYVYECPACQRMVFRKRPHPHGLACGVCCRHLAAGGWDDRFELRLMHKVKLA